MLNSTYNDTERSATLPPSLRETQRYFIGAIRVRLYFLIKYAMFVCGIYLHAAIILSANFLLQA